MPVEREKAPEREYTLKQLTDEMCLAAIELGALAMFSKRKAQIRPEKLERFIRDEINANLKILSTLARYKNKDGTFGNRGTGAGGVDVLRYSPFIAEEIVKRVAEKISIPKPVDEKKFRETWRKNSMELLERDEPPKDPATT